MTDCDGGRALLGAKGPAFALRLGAKEVARSFAVDRHGEVVGHRLGVHLDAEVEVGAGQEGCAVDRENQHGRRIVLCGSRHDGQRSHNQDQRQ